ncbi:MAG: cation transporter [Candidatus Nanopelagicales bacterium]|nr:cation transporter [Candidatus Nanopelagicales bacterium]
MQTTINVSGMTCGHCVSAVTMELSLLPTVTEVEVNLETGQVTITSDAALEQAQLATAIDEAGYELVTN